MNRRKKMVAVYYYLWNKFLKEKNAIGNIRWVKFYIYFEEKISYGKRFKIIN